MANQRRIYKVAERMRSILAMSILRMSDPRFSLITITNVQVADDLRLAKVYWTAPHKIKEESDGISQIEMALGRAVSAFRRELAEELGLRFVPNLRFYYDDTLDVQMETEALFQRVRESYPAEGVGGHETKEIE